MPKPNTDLVTVAWLKLVPGVSQAATKLPEASVLRSLPGGFVRVLSGIGGFSPLDVPLRRPVVQIECWAAPAEGSQKVPWGVASDLAESIFLAQYDPALMDVTVDLVPVTFGQARVRTVNAQEPRKIEGDPSGFARFDVDAMINWTGV